MSETQLKFDRLRPDEYTRNWKVDPRNVDLPAVVRPVGSDSSLEALKRLVRANHEEIVSKMHSVGAVLFRGFDVKGPQDFEDVALLLNPKLSKEYLGTSPRNAVTEYTFTASELPNFFPIPQHIEMSFLPSQPKTLMFSCLRPSLTGGETPLCDFSRVYQDLEPNLRAKFEKNGVFYIRNYTSPTQRIQLDPWKLKRWPEIFLTTDRSVVEKVCQREHTTPEWKPDGGLRLTNNMHSVVEHNGKKVWSNHSQVFHPSQAAQEYRRISHLSGVWWHYLLWVILSFVLILKRIFQKEEDEGLNTMFGDRKRITEADMELVRDAIWKNMVLYPWKRGDIVFIDNSFVSHGRLPYTGPRTVLVAWGE